jgi:hypothetical protein
MPGFMDSSAGHSIGAAFGWLYDRFAGTSGEPKGKSAWDGAFGAFAGATLKSEREFDSGPSSLIFWSGPHPAKGEIGCAGIFPRRRLS